MVLMAIMVSVVFVAFVARVIVILFDSLRDFLYLLSFCRLSFISDRWIFAMVIGRDKGLVTHNCAKSDNK